MFGGVLLVQACVCVTVGLAGKVPKRTDITYLPKSDRIYRKLRYYIEDVPHMDYQRAPKSSVEAFNDMKYGIRIHWGTYAMLHQKPSWDYRSSNYEKKQKYQQLYKTWNPRDFDAEKWVRWFKQSGMNMFAFTTKHHDGFSMYNTKTRVKSRVNWTHPDGPQREDCDLAYSIMETPFKRDITKELCDAARKYSLKIDLYYSHPDWYDADFRGYGLSHIDSEDASRNRKEYGPGGLWRCQHYITLPAHTDSEKKRMIGRHRQQLVELLSNYGKIDMVCLDVWWGKNVWPDLRETMKILRKIQPEVMFRARGIGNYGDYYTPEKFVPESKASTHMPWFVIYPLGGKFSYDVNAGSYKGAKWILHNLINSVAKGGNFMVAIGPDADGNFHPTAVKQIDEAGVWLKLNGECIYKTRPRAGKLYKENDDLFYTCSKDSKNIYAIATKWPGAELLLTTIKTGPETKISMPGHGPVTWQETDDGLRISLPEKMSDETQRPCKHAWVFKIEGSRASE
jgi:alpha-L-fucosidase